MNSARLFIRGYVVEYLAYIFHTVQITKFRKEKSYLEDIFYFGGGKKGGCHLFVLTSGHSGPSRQVESVSAT